MRFSKEEQLWLLRVRVMVTRYVGAAITSWCFAAYFLYCSYKEGIRHSVVNGTAVVSRGEGFLLLGLFCLFEGIRCVQSLSRDRLIVAIADKLEALREQHPPTELVQTI